MRRLAACIGLVVAVVAATVPAASAAVPTVVYRASAPLADLAADGGHLAWMTVPPPGDCYVVRSMWLRTEGTQSLTGCRPNPASTWPGGSVGNLAVGGARVAWTEFGTSNSESSSSVLHTRLPGGLGSIHFPGCGLIGNCSETVASRIAGAGGRLVYAVWDFSPDTGPGCGDPGGCTSVLTGGRAWELDPQSGQTTQVPGVVAPAAHLAVSGTLGAWVSVQSPGRVHVASLPSGTETAQVVPNGKVMGIAVTAQVLAVLVRGPDGQLRVVRYDPQGGAERGATPIRAGASPVLDITGTHIVVGYERRILVVDALSGRPSTLLVSSAPLSGVNASGGAVTWFRNVGVFPNSHGVIYRVALG